jgi:hypothetical protein
MMCMSSWNGEWRGNARGISRTKRRRRLFFDTHDDDGTGGLMIGFFRFFFFFFAFLGILIYFLGLGCY